MAPVLIWPATVLAAVAILVSGGLRAWRGWLEWKRLELAARNAAEAPEPMPGARIEIADLRERLRKLEAIARGVEL